MRRGKKELPQKDLFDRNFVKIGCFVKLHTKFANYWFPMASGHVLRATVFYPSVLNRVKFESA